jgi:hypothetical protein
MSAEYWVRSAEVWVKEAEHYGAVAILFSQVEWACGPQLAYLNARRAARAALREPAPNVPGLREYPRSLYRDRDDPLNVVCECGHFFGHHVADRLPCLVGADDCSCRAYKRKMDS